MAPFTFLDRKNRGDAHSNFNGIAEAAGLYEIPVNTLRDRYIIHRRNRHTILAPIRLEDPDAVLIALVDSCVNGEGEKSYTVFQLNEDMLKVKYKCGMTCFADIIKRRKLDPDALLRLKQSRGDFISTDLVETIRSNKIENLKGE